MTREVDSAVYRSVEGGRFLVNWWDLPLVFPLTVGRWAAEEAEWFNAVEESAYRREVIP
jgi:hypothetical protein